jgi:hypothetical protein
MSAAGRAVSRALRARLTHAARALAESLVGRAEVLPPELLARYPELGVARWRRGGIALRVGGWCLGAATVSGITLWRTVFLSARVGTPERLLLHELAHVHQFGRVRGFPVRYCWESIRRGYYGNRFEREADVYADRLVAERAAHVGGTRRTGGRSP